MSHYQPPYLLNASFVAPWSQIPQFHFSILFPFLDQYQRDIEFSIPEIAIPVSDK